MLGRGQRCLGVVLVVDVAEGVVMGRVVVSLAVMDLDGSSQP